MEQNNTEIKDLDKVIEKDFSFFGTIAEVVIWEHFTDKDVDYLLMFKKKLNQLISKKQRGIKN